ncbi:Fc.00g037900.m01.CDS01 [Cosmosporella sp. VM-42]
MSLHNLDTNPPNGGRDNASLLSPIGYDDDAASLHSRSDQDTDSEDDELISRARNSRELRAHDRIVLMEEEEMDKLVVDSRRKQERQRRGSGRRGSGLAVPNPLKIFGRRPSITQSSSAINDSSDDLLSEKRSTRRSRRKQKKERLLEHAQHGEDGELMYEMEEGGMKDGSSTGDSSERDDSDEMDRRQLNMIAAAKSERRRSWRRWLLIHALIAIGFAILVLTAWKLSKNRKSAHVKPLTVVSNGTALFGPTTLIISLDGFRADFLQRGLTPRLNAFVAEGVSPKWMHPSFPSVTFPNHYTIATGLYPESHGIVSNQFWDPALQAEFWYTDPDRSLDPKWWGGEPFWVTAERSGIRSAIHMWPGSEAHILETEPSLVDKFNGKELLEKKVARIMEFLDMPGMEDATIDVNDMRPQLIAAYVPNVDSDGHKYGPNSTEIRDTISKVDTMMDQIFQGLEQRNLTDIVNVIVVSDHGMATTDVTRMMQLEDLIDVSKIEHTDGWPLYGLRPKSPDDLQELYDGLAEKSKTNPNFEVYLRDVNMPERYHFSNNDRIAPLWIVPKTGWAIVTNEEFSVKEGLEKGLVYHPQGLHGYDHEHPLMRAIFIARGPAFPHPANSQIEVFQNIEVYNILCDSLGIEPKPNNGTLRLPLKPIGLHNPGDTPETPEDPVSTVKPTTSAEPSAKPESSIKPERPTIPEKPPPERPTVHERPSQPARPTVPEKPSAQEKPTEVEQPTQPAKPETPAAPEKPTEAEKPAQPSAPSQPTKPGKATQYTTTATPTVPSPSSGSDGGDDVQEEVKGFWEWLTDKVDKIWDKVTSSGSR